MLLSGDPGVLGLILEPAPRTTRLLKTADVPGSAYALEIGAFFDARGRLPEPGVPDEKGLYRCLQQLRRCVGGPDGGTLLAGLDGVPGVHGYPGCEAEDRIEAVIRWAGTHGRVPSLHSDDLDERRLSRSWKLIRAQYGTLSADGRERFDAVEAEYRRLRSSSRRPALSDPERRDPEMQLQKLKAWCAGHGHLPRSSRVQDETTARMEERRLALWMSHRINPRRKTAAAPPNPRIRTEILGLKARYPAYRAYRRAKDAERSVRDKAALQVLASMLSGQR